MDLLFEIRQINKKIKFENIILEYIKIVKDRFFSDRDILDNGSASAFGVHFYQRFIGINSVDMDNNFDGKLEEVQKLCIKNKNILLGEEKKDYFVNEFIKLFLKG